jgi:hypothetical protein
MTTAALLAIYVAVDRWHHAAVRKPGNRVTVGIARLGACPLYAIGVLCWSKDDASSLGY